MADQSTLSAPAPKGFRFAGVHCGIKRNPNKPDLTLVVSDRPASAAGVYTQNRVFAAPVEIDRQRTPSDDIRVVIVNSGNANACTGQRGLDDARRMCQWAAAAAGADEQQALVMSTGIIGEFLPMEKIEAGVAAAAPQLGDSAEHLLAAARGLLTTDTRHKLAFRHVVDSDAVVTGMAKGAAMIGPNMATMLALLLTDAALSAEDVQAVLSEAADDTFNCISVEGHTSTNDTVLLLANGAAGGQRLQGDRLTAFRNALGEVCAELARAIPDDGEGAEHLITIDVAGCATRDDARRIAKTVADSPLVKTAIAGADPNWGRIVSAVGYAGVAFDPTRLALRLNGVELYRDGRPQPFDASDVSRRLRENREVSIRLQLTEGDATARFWTTDLTEQYVRLNADYHT